MVVFLPFWFLIPLLIVLESGPPVFFKHKRVGKNAKAFYLYKFRSMVKGADRILHEEDEELLKQFKEGDWKIANDPRITKLGKALRSLTIDEFPQLWNVIKGEMSMVGPRAYVKKELVDQVRRYPETKQYLPHIISVKPGITGVWQTSGRNEIPFVQRARMDAEYAQKKSILYDIKLLFDTPKAMLSKW